MAGTVHFTKMHGVGNDYIYVDCSRYAIADPHRAAICWSDRHKGIGSDGLVLIDYATTPDADFSMRIFNADGSEAMMCGNASRCVAKYLFDNDMTRKTAIRLQTLSGIKTLNLNTETNAEDGSVTVKTVRVDMGEPRFDVPEQVVKPLLPDIADSVFVSMGNPHFVVFVDDAEAIDVAHEGRLLEHHAAFPQRCNIEFVTPTAIKDRLRMRVWERGSGITQACGTGACATAVAAASLGKAPRTVCVEMDGGEVMIEWDENDNHVYMTGTATKVFEGEIEMV